MELFHFSNDDLLCAECIENLVVRYSNTQIDHSYLKHLSRSPWPLQKSYFCITSFIRTSTLRNAFYLHLVCIEIPGWPTSQKQVEDTILLPLPLRKSKWYRCYQASYSITITLNPFLILILRSLLNVGILQVCYIGRTISAPASAVLWGEESISKYSNRPVTKTWLGERTDSSPKGSR